MNRIDQASITERIAAYRSRPSIHSSGDVFVAPKRVIAADGNPPRRRITESVATSESDEVPLGQQVRDFRREYGVAIDLFTRLSGLDSVTISNFEVGKHPLLYPKRVIGLMKGLEAITVDDPRVEAFHGRLIDALYPRSSQRSRSMIQRELEELKINREEKRWFKMAKKVGFRNAITYRRLHKKLSIKDLANQAKISKASLYEYEYGQRKPHLDSLNEIIKALDFDSEGKVAQVLRLQVSGRSIMTTQEVQTANLGDMVDYLRILKGEIKDEAASTITTSRPHLATWQRGVTPVESSIKDIFNWLGISQDSALAKILEQKRSDQVSTISTVLLGELLSEKYLFTDSRNEVPDFFIKKEKDTLREIDALGESYSFDEVLAVFTAVHREENITLKIRGKKIPSDERILSFIGKLGYTIHHDIVHVLLKTADSERRKRHKRRERAAL